MLHIQRTRSEDDDRRVISRPAKTRASIVRVPIPASCVAVLRTHHDAQQFIIASYPGAWEHNDLVLPGRGGRMLGASTIGHRLRALARKAGVPEITPHELRHNGATLPASASVSATAISSWLRHTSAAFTLDVYTHASDADQRDAGCLLEARLTHADDAPVADTP